MKEPNLSYNKIVPVFSSRLKTKESKDKIPKTSTNKKSSKAKEAFSFLNTSKNQGSNAKKNKIELNISGTSKNTSKKFSYHQEFPSGIKSLTKVSSEVRNRYDATDLQEPELDYLKQSHYSIYSSEEDSEREEFIDSDFKNQTSKLLKENHFLPKPLNTLDHYDCYDEYSERYKPSGRKLHTGVNPQNLEEEFKLSLASNSNYMKTPMFCSPKNEENNELRKTTKRDKISDLRFMHKSDQETEHFTERIQKDEDLDHTQIQPDVGNTTDE